MWRPASADVLQAVAERIVSAYLLRNGATRAEIVHERESIHGTAVDLVVIDAGGSRRVKLKADPYFGTDPRKISDRGLSFYRADASSFAFEAVADSDTREPGWTLVSDADDLYYYYLALSQVPEEIEALLAEPDDVFFSELAVERDELIVLPMPGVRAWFERRFSEYAARPVMLGEVAAWYRLVPRHDVERAVSGVRIVGPIFAAVAR